MGSLTYAKESILLNTIQLVADNDKRTQTLELSGAVTWQAKSATLTASLADALISNTKLTSLNLSRCNIGDGAMSRLADALKHSATLYYLDLSDNKLGRPGLVCLAQALATNIGLEKLDLTGHRINSDVCSAFVTMFETNVTLCRLLWKLEVSGYNLKFTELSNRNIEIDRCVKEGKDYTALLPQEMRADPPVLEPRIIPNPDDEEFGMEVGEAGQMVWCQVEGKWELGTVAGTRRRKLVVTVEEESCEFDPKDVTPFEPSHARDLPNMVQMHNLHEAPLLYLLQRRLKDGRIYTWAGDVLLALNPYFRIPELYQISKFLDATPPGDGTKAAPSAVVERDRLPHIYSIAKRANVSLVSMMALSDAEKMRLAEEGHHVDQSVLISGESGAGKTEASKQVLEYLTSASRAAKQRQAGKSPSTSRRASENERGPPDPAWKIGDLSASTKQEPVSVEFLLREASPVLEAFGNAKTIRNDNSSRFGKFTAVQYSMKVGGGIVGASTETYLLERSRVVDVGQGERNYHIFYQFLTDSKIRERWKLPTADKLAYLSFKGTVASVDGANDAKDFVAVKRALETFGVKPDDQAKSKESGDAEVAHIADDAALKAAAKALGCSVEGLRFPLLSKNMHVMNDTIVQYFTCKAAAQARDALAKIIFAGLFDWMVARVNETSRHSGTNLHTIGILDIFGFEQLKVNSFEQLCINYVNEMLQEQFNESVFSADRRLLAAEGIEIDDGALQSSAARLALMTRLLQGLDDQCRLGERGSDAEYLQEIGQQHTVRGICQLEQRGVFSIFHYAGKVFYNAEGFVMKNQDQMSADMQTLMRECKALDILVDELFATVTDAHDSSRRGGETRPPRSGSLPELNTPRSGNHSPPGELATPRGTKKPKAAQKTITLGGRLRAGIGEVSSTGKASSDGLIGLLRRTSLHYVRCVKPNDSMAAFGFEQTRVLRQLQYSGVLEMVRIRRQGFPGRMSYEEFSTRYAPLILDLIDNEPEQEVELVKTRTISIMRRSSHSTRVRRYGPKGETKDAAVSGESRGSFRTRAPTSGFQPRAPSFLGKVKNALTRPEDKDEVSQEMHEMKEAEKVGRGVCLAILRRANLHEQRHYQFGKTLLFLRNGVEGVLQAAMAKQMLAITWFQKTARMRKDVAYYRSARDAIQRIQCASRVRRARKIYNSRKLFKAQQQKARTIVRIVEPRVRPWLARRKAASLMIQRYGRGRLARRLLRRLQAQASRSKPLVRLRHWIRLVSAFNRAAAAFRQAGVECETRRARHAKAVLTVQAGARGQRARSTVRRQVLAAKRLQRHVRSKVLRSRMEAGMMETMNRVFRAIYNDEQDGLQILLCEMPSLLLVRQNRAGQRASLFHAAAAGGAVRIASDLAMAMHGAAVKAGRETLPQLEEGASAEERSEARLQAAVRYCIELRDAIGRTPMHYAARSAELVFFQWATPILSLRRADDILEKARLGSTAAADPEIKRAVIPLVMPAGGARSKHLVVLGQMTLQVYSLPSGVTELAAASAAVEGKNPTLKLATEKLLYRKSDDRSKRDCIEVVIIKKVGRKLQQTSMFESQASEDVLELHMGNASAVRSWMAAFHSPRYLLSRGMHLVSAVAGKASARRQVDLWERAALVNLRDNAGETPLHSALRGADPGERAEHVRMLAWMLDTGGVPVYATSPALPAADPLALLLEKAGENVSEDSDSMYCELLNLLLSRTAAYCKPADVSSRLDTLKSSFGPKLLDTAPLTQAVLMRAQPSVSGGESAFASLPAPSEENEGRSLILLSLAKVDLAGSGFDDVAHHKMSLTISMVHEPAGVGGRAAAGVGGPSTGVASRSAVFEEQAKVAGAAGGNVAKVARRRLATLVAEQRSGPPLQSAAMDNNSTLWWHSTWSAPYLLGEEGAFLLVSLVQTGAGADEIVGWTALPCDELGEVHAQLHPAPLPTSVTEAKFPRTEPLEAWLHGELSLALTGSFVAYKLSHAEPPVPVRQSTSASSRQSKKGFFRRASLKFTPLLIPRRRSSSSKVTAPQLDGKISESPTPIKRSSDVYDLEDALSVLQDLPEPPSSLEELLTVELQLEEVLPREKLIYIVRAAAEAAKGARPEFALRGYCFAFVQSGHAATLLSIGNMHLKLRNFDAASEVYKYLNSGDVALTADQQTVLLDKTNEVEEEQLRMQGGQVSSRRPPDFAKRASIRHQLLDKGYLKDLEDNRLPGTSRLASLKAGMAF